MLRIRESVRAELSLRELELDAFVGSPLPRLGQPALSPKRLSPAGRSLLKAPARLILPPAMPETETQSHCSSPRTAKASPQRLVSSAPAPAEPVEHGWVLAGVGGRAPSQTNRQRARVRSWSGRMQSGGNLYQVLACSSNYSLSLVSSAGECAVLRQASPNANARHYPSHAPHQPLAG